jgi:DNA primase
MYAKSDIELIRSKIEILSFLESRGLSFRQTGTSFIGLCPVHNERSPSFHVNPIRNTYHCFGCGIGGDIFQLIIDMDSLTFAGAVQEAAEYANIELVGVEEDEAYKAKQRLYHICDIATTWFRQNFLQLPDDHPAKQNLADRHLLYVGADSAAGYSAQTDKTVGFAPAQGLIDLLTKARFSVKEIVEAGLATTSETDGKTRDKFRNRLVWTVTDIQGRAIGFSARKVFETDLGPKYLNSPQTPLYNKSRTLLGLGTAKKEISRKQEVYIVEGQTDVMALRAIGIENVVASCGTAFGPEHTNMLLHLSSIGKSSEKFKMIFCFDGDAAGVNAAKKVFEANKSIQLNSFVVKLDAELGDPCDLRLNYGDEALRNALKDNQTGIVEFILLEEKNSWDMKTPEGQSGYLNKAKEILSLINDPIQYTAYLRKVSFWTGISYEQINTMVKQSARRVDNSEEEANLAAHKLDSMEVKFLAAYLQYPEEVTALIKEYKIGGGFFSEQRELAGLISAQIEGREVDYSNPEISRLTHIDLKVAEERKDLILRSIIKAFLKEAYSRELAMLNGRLTELNDPNAGDPDENLLEEILLGQSKLKQKYSI